MKPTKTLYALLAVLTLTGTAAAQVSYDFQSVTPAGDTLLYTIVDSAAHHVSVRGDASSYNTHYIHYNADLVLPDSVEHNGETYAVVEIEAAAFRSHLEIETITVPDGIATIGSMAFLLIPNVAYHGVAMGSPWGANTINGYEEDSLFYFDSSKTCLTGCRNITSAVVPPTVSVIGRNAFYYHSTLQSVILPDGLDTIGTQAFCKCDGLASIQIPSSVRSIGPYAFYSAFRPDATVTIDDAPATIENAAFYYSNMRHIDLGNSITRICNNAFTSCSNLDTVVVPNSVNYIGSYAFCYNYSGSLKRVVLPEGMDTIRVQTFFGCTGLEEVDIPSTVVYIDTAAFYECWQLGSLTLPAGLTGIADNAFDQCHNIDTLFVLAEVPPAVGADAFLWVDNMAVLVVPCGTEQAYSVATGWRDFDEIVSDCEGIGDIQTSDIHMRVRDGHVIVEGAEGETVQVFDAVGRGLRNEALPAGLYLVKVGDRPAQKVIVMK